MIPVDPQLLRTTLRYWASGVTIVTTKLGDQRGGMTVSAFNSLSLEPAQIVICLNKDASSMPLLKESGIFAVNILATHQNAISDLFGGRIKLEEGKDRFDGLSLKTAATGAPILTDALAYLDCRVKSTHDGETHWIIIGEVLATEVQSEPHAPLVYYNRGYRKLESFE